MENKLGDLEEKLRRGEITPKEAKRQMHARGLGEKNTWFYTVGYIAVWVVYFALCILPALATEFEVSALAFLAKLPVYKVPLVLIYIVAAAAAAALALLIWMNRTHRKWGGLKEAGETITFYRQGPFRVIRHPGTLGFIVGGTCLAIFMGWAGSFTPLTIVAIILWLVVHYAVTLGEEKENIAKWGDTYRRYTEEVPRFNFIQGLWRLWRRRAV